MNQKLNDLKQEYESIKPSDEFRNKINTLLQQTPSDEIEQKNKTFQKQKRYFGAIAAGFAIAAVGFIGTLNVSPAFAATVSELPGMDQVVKVLTFNKYEFSEKNIEAEVITPEITGLSDKELEEALNEEFQEYSNEIIKKFEEDAQELLSEFPESDPHMGIFSGYEVKTNTDDYLALDIYVTNIVGSSSDVHQYYTIDKHTNTLLTLPDLFQKNADYVTPISEYILEEMKRQNTSGENFYWIDNENPELNFQSINLNQKFYINEKGNIVICFDKYEVAPGSSGTPTFEIPNDVVADILNTSNQETVASAYVSTTDKTNTTSISETELSEEELKQKLTESFDQNGEKILEAFQKDLSQFLAESSDSPHMGITSGYEVKTNTKDYLALNIYAASTTNTFSTQKYYTIDKNTNTLLTLADFFQPNADYVTPISEYIAAEMRRQNASGENFYWIDNENPELNFQSIKKDQSFYVNEKGNIVICFDKYEIAPGSSGSPTFEIPKNVIAELFIR